MKPLRRLPASTRILSALPLLAATGAWAAALPVDPRTTVTATMDGGTAKTGNTWYEIGVNAAAPTTGVRTGLVAGQTDPLSTFLIQPATGPNVLMLDGANPNGGFTFNSPLTMAAVALVGASGNGAGTVVPTLRFADNTTKTLSALTVGDWFNNQPRVETVSGRIHAVDNAFANVGQDNPRILSVSFTLAPEDAAKPIAGIDLSWTGGATTHTALFGVSGDFTGLGHFSAIPLNVLNFNQDVIVGAIEAIPEPGPAAVLGTGALALLVLAQRSRRS